MAPELRELTGQVVIVTGAASGIGAATASLLLDAGSNVVAGDLHEDRLDPLVQKWGPDRVVAVGTDVRDPAASERLVLAGIEAWGHVDSVIANAGVGYFGGILDYGVDKVETMVGTNFLGTVWLVRAAVQHFRTRGEGGDIVVVGSVAGLGVGGGNEAVYAATKAAQIQLATSLDRELRAEGIRVSVIAPAAVNTPFAAATGRFGEKRIEDGEFIRPADVGYAVVTTLRQPRRIRTALWTLWSLAESNG